MSSPATPSMWPTSDMSSGDPIVIDATVYRSLGVLGLGCELLDAWRCVTINTIFDPPDGGEIGRIAAAIRRETSTLQHGSAASSLWGAATDQLASLILLLAQVDVVPQAIPRTSWPRISHRSRTSHVPGGKRLESALAASTAERRPVSQSPSRAATTSLPMIVPPPGRSQQ